ncbi:MAG: alpha-L-fucosidase [Bacteroidales bacterium]|nr:alpha-L-fucosidase [Bacteroidales bacterium]
MKLLLLSIILSIAPITDGDIWNLPPLKPETGLYTSDWDNLSRYYNVPEWWRDAKLGAWSHWDPQSAAEDGDWYARGMYMQNSPQYKYHLEHYGHPSEYGYKDLCNDWVIDLWDPDDLMQLYIRMGARYFLAMGNHHDNFDCWDSAYQPWNSVNVGPKKDIVGIWKETARKYGMPFGIGFHATPARTYGQFMPVRFRSDRSGPYQGVPYDAYLTKEDGEGKWWEGLDPKDLYGPEHHDGRNSLETPFADQFMWRVDDAIRKYQPDMIYFDEHAGDSQIDLGINMGLGRFTPQILENFYNIALEREEGNRQVVATFKGVGGRYDSFQNNPELLPLVDRSLVKSTEFFTEDQIMAFPFQTEVSLQEWHYMQGAPYRSAAEIILRLMQNVSRNGSLLLNITQRGRGNIDDEARQICEDIGVWMRTNAEAVYGSRPFDTWGDENVLFTRNNGRIYVTLIDWDGSEKLIEQLASGSASVSKIRKVRILGDRTKVKFKQTPEGLKIYTKKPLKKTKGISDEELAKGFKVIEIRHTKGWFNDDDRSVSTIGWDRKVNLGTGDYNNDLYFTDNPGDEWSTVFNGRSVTLISPTGKDYGKMKVEIDGKDCGVVDLSVSDARKAQQSVFKSRKLRKGSHSIKITSVDGTAAIDALIVK